MILPPRNCGTCRFGHPKTGYRFSVRCERKPETYVDGRAFYRQVEVTAVKPCHSFPLGPDGNELPPERALGYFRQREREDAEREARAAWLDSLPPRVRWREEQRLRESDAVEMHRARVAASRKEVIV